MSHTTYRRRDERIRKAMQKLDRRDEMKRKAFLTSGLAILAFNFLIARIVCS